MEIIARMSRPFYIRIAALGITAALITACGGSPAPAARRAVRASPTPSLVATSVPGIAPPAVAAESAIVVDMESGRVLFSKNADQRRQVASTQKIISALCVLDAGDLNKTVTISASDVACQPTKMGFKPGEMYSRKELLKALMVKSANDVARALARDVGDSQEGFSTLMNQKAASLGMRNSYFRNPNGLPDNNQYSTARDIAIAARSAYRSPLLRSYVATKSFGFRFNNGQVRLLENTNRILKTLPYCDGMKTGTTDAAGRCLVATGALNGRAVVVVVLRSNSQSVWADSTKLLRWSLERPSA